HRGAGAPGRRRPGGRAARRSWGAGLDHRGRRRGALDPPPRFPLFDALHRPLAPRPQTLTVRAKRDRRRERGDRRVFFFGTRKISAPSARSALIALVFLMVAATCGRVGLRGGGEGVGASGQLVPFGVDLHLGFHGGLAFAGERQIVAADRIGQLPRGRRDVAVQLGDLFLRRRLGCGLNGNGRRNRRRGLGRLAIAPGKNERRAPDALPPPPTPPSPPPP